MVEKCNSTFANKIDPKYQIVFLCSFSSVDDFFSNIHTINTVTERNEQFIDFLFPPIKDEYFPPDIRKDYIPCLLEMSSIVSIKGEFLS